MTVLQQLNREMADVVARIRPSLVQVRSGRQSGGAGVIWSSDGLIVTNAHVVAASMHRGRLPSVTLPDGRDGRARIVAYDATRDLAALQPTEAWAGTPAETGNARNLRPGDWVTAVGHPWGVTGAATSGAVIAVGRPPEIAYPGDLIQVGLHLRPGHSGGALVDDTGRLVGINCMLAGPDVGLAIPVHVIADFLSGARRA